MSGGRPGRTAGAGRAESGFWAHLAALGVKDAFVTFVKKNGLTFQEEMLIDLLRRTSHGDRTAFAALYKQTSAKLFGIIRRICISEEMSEEALQECYLLIWRNAGSFDPGKASPTTWMGRVARNKAIDIRRLQSERISSLGVELDRSAPSLEADAQSIVEEKEDLRRLLACLNQIAEDRREMILLAYFKGFSREEIGRRFGRPPNTVKTLIRRTLAQLKECIDGRG